MAPAAKKPEDVQDRTAPATEKPKDVQAAGEARAAAKDPQTQRMLAALAAERRGYEVRDLPKRVAAVDAQIAVWEKRA